MKIIMGTQELDNGELWSFPNLKISYFSQNFEINSNNSVEEEINEVVLNKDENYKIDIYCDNLNLNKKEKIINLSVKKKNCSS